METLYSFGHVFTNAPLRALSVALIFVALGAAEGWLARRIDGVRPWVQLVPATGWMLFALNEQHMALTGETGRFDLAITVPVLALVSLIGVVSFLGHVRTALRARRDARRNPEP